MRKMLFLWYCPCGLHNDHDDPQSQASWYLWSLVKCTSFLCNRKERTSKKKNNESKPKKKKKKLGMTSPQYIYTFIGKPLQEQHVTGSHQNVTINLLLSECEQTSNHTFSTPSLMSAGILNLPCMHACACTLNEDKPIIKLHFMTFAPIHPWLNVAELKAL